MDGARSLGWTTCWQRWGCEMSAWDTNRKERLHVATEIANGLLRHFNATALLELDDDTQEKIVDKAFQLADKMIVKADKGTDLRKRGEG